MDNSAITYRPRSITGALWAIQAVTAAMFLAAGISKLAGVTLMVQMFELIGVGQWFRYLTGGIEVVGAVLILIPAAASYGAAALAVTMVGAIITHLFVVGGNPAIPILLLASTALIAWARRTDR
jgi:putative oxidoreductase